MVFIVPPSGRCNAHAFRLHPGDPIMQSLKNNVEVILARQKQCSSAFMMTAVGSVSDITLRLANASKMDDAYSNGNDNFESHTSSNAKSSGLNDIRQWSNQRFEIVSLVGTFSRSGGCHLHISLSDATGKTIGGHLIDGIIFTTLEVVIGTIDNVNFSRELDDKTGYKELVPKQILSTEFSIRMKNRLLYSGIVGISVCFVLFRSRKYS